MALHPTVAESLLQEVEKLNQKKNNTEYLKIISIPSNTQ